MIRELSILALAGLASCVAVTSSHRPKTLVAMNVTGSPAIGPGGPEIYVDDVYRGNAIDERFQMWMEVGGHEVRVMGGSKLLWQGPLDVAASDAAQRVSIEYEVVDAPGAR